MADLRLDREVVELRHELHAHPELSMQESGTKARLMAFLRAHTALELHDMGRWFYAVYRAAAPTDKPIAYRADFDALPIAESPELCPYASQNPGVSHKCGHDGHSAALCAFALELERRGAARDVYLVFQHAEEIGSGGEECAAELIRLGVSEVYAVHNLPGVALGAVAAPDGVAQFASTGMVLAFTGTPSHACYPENGRNPAFAISELVLALEELRRSGNYRDLTLITVISVQVGEAAFGTSPGDGKLLLTVRAALGDELDDLLRRIAALAEEKARAHGLTLNVSYEDTFPETYNHPAQAEKMRRAATAAGLPVAELAERFRASEDFGWYTRVLPGAMAYVGAGEEHAPIHTVNYDFPDEIIPVIVKLFAGLL